MWCGVVEQPIKTQSTHKTQSSCFLYGAPYKNVFFVVLISSYHSIKKNYKKNMCENGGGLQHVFFSNFLDFDLDLSLKVCNFLWPKKLKQMYVIVHPPFSHIFFFCNFFELHITEL
jgi:hypothetical protein